ncbi:unnamed protein product, partial [Urochloa humidicola]
SQSRTPRVLRATKETDLASCCRLCLACEFISLAAAGRSKSNPSMASASASWTKRWLRPEVYPLFVATGVAVGICGMQLIRNITGNPEVRVLKEKRAAGVLENFDEGKRYSQHGFRKFIDGRKPEIMQSLNSWMADPPKDD